MPSSLGQSERKVSAFSTRLVAATGALAIALLATPARADAYETALADGITGKAEARARAFVNTHASRVGHLDVKGPDGAVLFIGGERRASLPLARPLAVLAGNVQVRVEQTEHEPWLGRLQIEPGRSGELRVELAPLHVADSTGVVSAVFAEKVAAPVRA